MSISIEAVYENGVLRPERPLPFKEREKVKVTVDVLPSVVKETAGMIPWAGDIEMLEALAGDPEHGVLGSP